jgi:pyridoxamine 5'-phosphate oxidase
MPCRYWPHDVEIATVNMVTQSLPSFYNDLAASLDMAWLLWGRGTADRHSGFHTPVVTSVDQDGNPQARTMILRAVDREARTMRFHTDVRSAKMLHWKFKSRVCVLGYDASKKIQLRVDGRVNLHTDDAVAEKAWRSSRPESRAAYGVKNAPGHAVGAPSDAPQSNEQGRENFAVAMVEVESLEWTYLSAEGNRRAIFSWQNGEFTSNWLQP